MSDREELNARMVAIFTGNFRGSVGETRLEKLRWLTPDLAIVEGDVTITGFSSPPTGVAPTEPGVPRTRISYVLERRGGGWVILTTQNTAVGPVR